MNSISLRDYQKDCITKIVQSLKDKKNRIVVKAPCSFGKTIVFCEIARRCVLKKSKTVIILDNVELVRQTYKSLLRFMDETSVGIFCSSLNSQDDSKTITVGTIQSIKNSSSTYQLIIIDECHDGISRVTEFCNLHGDPFVIGFSATPYDAKGRPIYGEEKFYKELAYEMKVSEMIRMKIITPMKYGAERDETKIDLSAVGIIAGDYNEGDLLREYGLQSDKVLKQIEDMLARTRDRSKIIIMCTGIKHANFVAASLERSITYHSEVSLSDRKKIIEDFEKGPYKFLIGVMAIYKGLDIPCVDCLVNMRPTRSKSFYVQFAGRGVRKFEGKNDCLFLDYGQTVENLGFYEDITEREIKKGGKGQAPVTFPKKCPECFAFVTPQTRECDCGYKFAFNSLNNTVEEAFNSKVLNAPTRFYSKVKDVVEERIDGSRAVLKVMIENPNDIPIHAKGSKYTVNFYYNSAHTWQIWRYKEIKSKIKAGEFMLWKLNDKGWPEFISSHRESTSGFIDTASSKDTRVNNQN